MSCGWEPVTGFGFAIGDRLADLGGDLLVQKSRVVAVDLDIQDVPVILALYPVAHNTLDCGAATMN